MGLDVPCGDVVLAAIMAASLCGKEREREKKKEESGARVQDTGADKRRSLCENVFQTDVKLHNAIV